MDNFKEEYEIRKRKIEESLSNFISIDEVSSPLREAMRHLILAGGKRLRPVLVYETYRICGGKDDEEILPPACSTELIHTFTLIHDDLPAIDNDDMRRGKPTVHKVFGEDIAILAGDALFIYGIEIFLKSKSKPEKILKALSSLLNALGPRGVIEGEVLDIKSVDMEPEKEYVRKIHTKKTAMFISSCLEIGAILGEAKEEEIKKFKEAGLEMGMAFQIQDDILDVTGDKEKLGKNVKKDANKMTYVRVYGLEKAKEIAQKHIDRAKYLLKELPYKTDFLQKICDFIIERNY